MLLYIHVSWVHLEFFSLYILPSQIKKKKKNNQKKKPRLLQVRKEAKAKRPFDGYGQNLNKG